MSTTSCRYYENKLPEVDELTVVNVRQIAEMGAYVRLLEYDNTEGMILLSELSRRRIRSIQKLIRVGRNEVVVVLRVDKEKGYIDLSKRRVSPEDIAKCEERYNKSKAVHSIMRNVADKHSIALESLYESVGWPLYRKYGHAYDAFKLAITQPDSVFADITPPNSEILKDLQSQIARRLTPQAIKIRADVEVTCFGYEGIDAIKTALRAADKVNTEENKVQVKLVAAPLFVVLTNALDKVVGIKLLEDAIAEITKSIKEQGGNLVVKTSPRAQSEQDDLELQKMMEKAEAENLEVSGDEEEDGEESDAE
ncbi:Translation initiation factor eIF2 alpha subunit [Taphrina deformans PYCC 5710]|uniref:Eukaryotic translation initiation factor 2 subunit alpha n=1 Tax=Taphrina deformans (strain PYCC 5710 / ATCC 11124 / CBS 356.35 / IMI 108563 / JCM 9778 / NBRC 8474) TaxID=1097556 RepID=R4X7V1_TAPDE|nr:Translation initiation factor eIF2 alpha subunit [Taphrina deformans PYCC 5710]|eukprot:CCG81510.1 Translation initiation factor eIF2 alpha subunit [Taphrina deformans PYCC 5710]